VAYRGLAKLCAGCNRECLPRRGLVYRGTQRQLEYDFIVAPATIHGHLASISRHIGIRIDARGNLILRPVFVIGQTAQASDLPGDEAAADELFRSLCTSGQ